MKVVKLIALSVIFIASYAKADGIILDGSKEISNQNFKSNLEVLNPQSPIKNIKVDGDLKIKGYTVLENVSVDGELECIGSLRIINGNISSARIKGNTVMENVKLDNLNLLGSLEANNLTVYKKAKIFGATRLMNSKLNNLTVSTEVLTLHHTKIDDLVMTSAPSMREVVDLKSSSKVSNVTFYSNDGTVNIYDKDSSVGKVYGGSVVKK